MKIGQIMRVKKGSEKKCGNCIDKKGSFVRVESVEQDGLLNYSIFNENKEYVSFCEMCFTAEDLEPLEKTFKTLEVGDLLKNRFGTRKVLAVLHNGNDSEESVYVLSSSTFEDRAGTVSTSFDIEHEGYTIVQVEPEKPEPKKMTVSEIAKALGHEVEVVKE